VRAFLIAIALALAGCASKSSDYARTDGVPVDPMHQQATLAQCKGEGAMAGNPGDYGRKEATVTDACMARNGYIRAQR